MENRTAWAAAGSGVLFYDADGGGTISEKREYVFTEWDPTATSDIEALRSVFDSNGDGVFDANDDAWGDFKVLVTQADGSLEAKTLNELGITSIDLTADATNIELPDGSVITGKTTFTYADGTTGTVADTTLVSETASHRIEESEDIDDDGVRTHIQTGYGADGAISFVITSVITADGSSITNSYDVNGDGVVDRVQTIETVSNLDGSKSETVTNKVGADFATGILVSKTKTTTSADGSVVTIERDSTGGGWYDQAEVRTTQVDDRMTIVTTDRDPNGGVIRSSTETISANGLVRTDAIDEDGDGSVDLTITHTIVINADGSRSETIQYFNEDGSLRRSVTETVSADGQTKTITRDLDGDGDTDVQEELDITVNADGTTDSTLTVKNGDGSVRSSSTHNQSDDALTKTSALDLDGDGDIDVTTVEATVIHANGSRETETTVTNTDGSVRDKVKVTLGSDLVSSKTWIDHNQDGVFQATDLSQSVTVDATTGERTTTNWSRNADGSFNAKSVSVASEDGLEVTTSIDADGDGDTDLVVSDVTVENADGTSTRTVTERAQDGTLISEREITTSANGLTVTTLTDADGDDTIDGKTVSVSTPNADGSVTQTQTVYAGDQTTLLAKATVTQSADRRVSDTTIDANGDGAVDIVLHSVKHADGSITETETRQNAHGEVLSKQKTDVSADGLTVTVATDLDGNDIVETKTVQETVLNADGGRTTTTTVHNGDDSLRSQSVTTISDDGLIVTTTQDVDGDGTVERTVKYTTELLADGSEKTIERLRAGDNSLLSRTTTIVSDDDLTVQVRSDNDGDGLADIVSSSTTVLNDDGGTTVTSRVRDVSGGGNVLRSQSVTTTSDDGRDVLLTTDVDGDGDVDFSVHRVVGDDGQVTVTETELNSDGSTISQMTSVTSDDGLETTTRYDADGNGAFERSVNDTMVLNADGSSKMTVEQRAEDGTVVSRTVVDTSADGWTSTTREDWDNDGDDDLTTVRTYDLAADGVETSTVTQTAADGSTLSTGVTETSADGRTVTQSYDADGNGVDDMLSVTEIDDTGTTTTNTQYFSDGGGLEAETTTTVSGDGLTIIQAVDRNGDGKADRIVTDTTELSGNGSTTRTVAHREGRNISLGKEIYTTSDDGLETTAQLDLDGDGLFDYTTDTITEFEDDGDIVTRQVTLDETFDVQSDITTTTSGNGLETRTDADYSGDGSIDRVTTSVVGADGSVTETVTEYGAGTQLNQSHVRTVSADGLTETITSDLDGDGDQDREITSVVDADGGVTTTVRDVAQDTTTTSEVVETTSANGLHRSLEVDLDGDGDVDITRSTDVSYDAQGNTVTTYTETGVDGQTTYREVQTVSADGLTSTSSFDLDGDGVADGTTQFETTLNDDGSKTAVSQTHYADGELRSMNAVSTSSDGRSIVQTEDFDGNGIADRATEVEIRADGEQVVTERAFNEAGYETNTFVTTTSADGLTQTILRHGNEQTITRSSLDNGSYTWDNGIKAALGQTHVVVSHEVDALGVETWSISRDWIEPIRHVTRNFEGQITNVWYTNEPRSSHSEVRLDQAAKARVLEEAASIFDTVLDRDADFTEFETLVEYVQNGQLNKAELVSDLIGSGEFAVRYGTLSDAEFVTQIYLNAYSRPPSLTELDQLLRELADDVLTRSDLALSISESAEHVMVGNGHMATNNFDVILNPAQFERSLDKAYIANLIKSLIDVVYDRDATAQEIAYLSERLLEDQDNLDDIAEDLLDLTGDIQSVASNSLNGLSGSEFVEQAFLNALGRMPTPTELQAWTANLADGNLTKAQLVASLAQSIEHQSVGTTHVATSSAGVTTNGTSAAETLTGANQQNDALNGQEGDDTLIGKGGSDVLTGGQGDDTLYGGSDLLVAENGNDIYVWSRGDGNDVIKDKASSLVEVDQLLLTDVASDEVQLVREQGSTSLYIIISSPNSDETIQVVRRFEHVDKGYGIEEIHFSDGVVWTLEDIEANTTQSGNGNNNTLNISGGYGDNLYGLDGDDTLDGNAGDDHLHGGLGDDTLIGNAGKDSYYWSLGDGNDRINEAQYSSNTEEVDQLIFSDVLSTDVTLTRTGSESQHLVITINSTGEEIRVDDQYSADRQGRGIEKIVFSDGVTWTLDDIIQNTTVDGTSGNDTLTGVADETDNLFGMEGDDTLEGKGGDDVLIGGTGDDTLRGGGSTLTTNNGNDTYIWSRGDGNDWLADNASSQTELDRLILMDVASTDVMLFRENGSDELKIIVSGPNGDEVIDVSRQFQSVSKGYGLEIIEFSDGIVWTREDIVAHTRVEGDSGSNTLNGIGGFDENFFGLGGNDTINANDGDDLLVGGKGDDTLKGGSGNDLYVWSLGDGNDTINDTATSLIESDTLRFLDLASDDVTLTRDGGDLKIEIGSTGEVIIVTNRFYSGSEGRGIEFIEFSDGVVVEVLNSAVAETIVNGTTAADTLNGWGFKDTIFGFDGDDTIEGKGGDDVLTGGKGDDILRGGNGISSSVNGSDTFIWSHGDGDDTIADNSRSQTEIDRLVLTDVDPSDVLLQRDPGSHHLLVVISSASGTETITINRRFENSSKGYGVEIIEFGDGTIWTLNDILENTVAEGNSNNNTINGSSYSDNLYGLEGNDKLVGKGGDDTLIGGTGNDILIGGGDGTFSAENGNDTYVWSTGGGGDTIRDFANSKFETDKLVLEDVDPGDVTLVRENGSIHLTIIVEGSNGTEEIVIARRFENNSKGYGVEVIEFSDGTIWTLDDILENTVVEGNSNNNTINGSSYSDNLYGLEGNDTLVGKDGDDMFIGGIGNDILIGGGNGTFSAENGNDTYVWSTGDGDDTIRDFANSKSETDKLVLEDADPDDVTLVRENGSNHLTIIVEDSNGTEEIVIARRFENNSKGYGIEVIEFGNGEIWTLDDILENTVVEGNANNNTINGSSYSDNLYGLEGNDTLKGHDGNDTLNGGLGDDTLVGGNGADEFVFNDNFGSDVINDFEDGIDLLNIGIAGVSYADLSITAVNSSDAEIAIAGHGTILVKDSDVANLSQEDFLFG